MVQFAAAAAAALLLATTVNADVYMHNPRGSNNRACYTGNSENRRNNNRLFDSQNNNKGGYPCPRARPYDCYVNHQNGATAEADTDACNLQGLSPASTPGQYVGSAADAGVWGSNDPNAIQTPPMYYYSGSQLSIEWTNQHGCGSNPKLHCDIVLQYACEDTLTDEWDGQEAGPRDGTPITNHKTAADYEAIAARGLSQDDARRLNQEATLTIPQTNDDGEQLDNRYGRHETLTYYRRCRNRERNKGLFIADQNVRDDRGATATRQNPNGDNGAEGQRQGLECPEESEYWPYWHDSPWKDIAVLTNRPDDCAEKVRWSQNTQSKWECVCPEPNCELNQNPYGEVPNYEAACVEKGGVWTEFPSHNLPAPHCGEAPMARENHLGMPAGANVGDTPFMASVYNWTIPHVDFGERCVLRLRYNISTGDYDSVSLYGTSANSPLINRNKEGSYKAFKGCSTKDEKICEFGLDSVNEAEKLQVKMNTNQFGRTFQDRSYLFQIKKPPATGECGGKKIYNLNVRGKRGNIVQTYPAVEYDFIPSHLEVSRADCIHVQWTGSDYNNNRNPNNGEGGPPAPDYDERNQGRTDRHNLVQMPSPFVHEPVKSYEDMIMFELPKERFQELMYIKQPIDDPEQCHGYTKIEEDYPSWGNNERERYHRNCGNLSGAKTPYFDAGLVRPGHPGAHAYMSTRDNNFSNRAMKGILTVRRGLSSVQIAFTVLGVFALLSGVGYFAIARRRKNEVGAAGPKKEGSKPMMAKTADSGRSGRSNRGAAAGASVTRAAPTQKAVPVAKVATKKVRAMYNHEASEPGELAFKKGDIIEIVAEDSSGWWQGKIGNKRGVLPSNYVAEV